MLNISHEHHLHRRKRTHVHHEPYPHPDPLKRFMDRLIYVVGVAGPAFVVPQTIQIWTTQSIGGLSFITQSAGLVFSFLWLSYGILHREKVIIFSNILWIIVNGCILAEMLILR
jgi:uncharacterized protein with PQ loop repeat